ncbi:uncharacterized protein [Littorina saxatilis]|uniref:MYND-type domain-containing protein n=1 Tax=Littorina saxatilis TaxID=31220 RepID=A0AAN9AM78_9CAEN
METCCQCGKYGDGSTIRRCSRCKSVRYCSRDCQARHWPQHKVTCTSDGEAAISSQNMLLTDNFRTPRTDSLSRSTTTQPRSHTSFAEPLSKDPWQQIRSTASSAFPGNRIVNSFDDLGRKELVQYGPTIPFTPIPLSPTVFKQKFAEGRTGGVVIVLRLVSPLFHPFRRKWTVEDSKGTNAHVSFEIPESPAPHFRYDDLQRGHFLCVRQAAVTLYPQGLHFVLVKESSSVRVFTG